MAPQCAQLSNARLPGLNPRAAKSDGSYACRETGDSVKEPTLR
jgi:hypothetical protein